MNPAIHPVVHGAVSSLHGVLDIIARKVDYRHAQVMGGLRASSAELLVSNVVRPQIEAIRGQCEQTLALFSEQARHYMAQQERLEEQRMSTKDVMVIVQVNARLGEIDTRLADIRADAQLLYARMCAVLLAAGGGAMALARDLTAPLEILASGTMEGA